MPRRVISWHKIPFVCCDLDEHVVRKIYHIAISNMSYEKAVEKVSNLHANTSRKRPSKDALVRAIASVGRRRSSKDRTTQDLKPGRTTGCDCLPEDGVTDVWRRSVCEQPT